MSLLWYFFAAYVALGQVEERPVSAVPPFVIQVVDEQTGRGVPLVELTTTNSIRLWTDSNGLVAFNEPGLMDTRVWFSVRSHGYEHPADGFGSRGVGLQVKPGGQATIKIKRLNIAERLYRQTGQGIYRDTVLAGRKAPTTQPVIDGLVMGCDSVLTTIYKGRLFWIWGDTGKPSYPLGNFHCTGATSRLPADGGLDPALGVDFDYFTAPRGGSTSRSCSRTPRAASACTCSTRRSAGRAWSATSAGCANGTKPRSCSSRSRSSRPRHR